MTRPEGCLAMASDADGARGAGDPRPAIETLGLTKRYPRLTALSDCSITVPPGRICALVGPNGAGKTTLLRMLAGLARPTSGTAAVLGGAPRQHPAFLAQIGYLAQEIPLYRRLSAEDHIRAGAHLNRRWDDAAARARLSDLRVPLGQAVGTLSGGQRAQVALTLALAKQPRVLLLDEPVAALDPLARRQFLATLTSAVANAAGELTVLLSSHVIADVERICDHMVLLTASRVQLCGDIEELLAAHKLLVGPRKDTSVLERTHTVVQATRTDRQSTLLVRLGGPVLDPAYTVSDIGLEDLVLAYLGADSRRPDTRTSPRLEKTYDLAHVAAVPRAGGDRGRTAGRVRGRADRQRGADGVPVALRTHHVHGRSLLRQPRRFAVPGQPLGGRPDLPEPRGAGCARAADRGAAGGQRGRNRHRQLRLDAERDPRELAAGQGRLAAAGRRRLGRLHRRPDHLVVGTAQRALRQRVPVQRL